MIENKDMPTSDSMSVGIVMTGGTIAKTYSPHTAQLENTTPVVEMIIDGLTLHDLELEFVDLFHLDSLDMNLQHRQQLAAVVADFATEKDAILITHGTDTLVETANEVSQYIESPPVPIVFTGAMVPFVIEGSDAMQNITESLLAIRFLRPGFYVVFHNRVLKLPDAVKDYDRLTFAATAE